MPSVCASPSSNVSTDKAEARHEPEQHYGLHQAAAKVDDRRGSCRRFFVSTLYLTLDTGDDKDHTYRPKVDKEVSVLTDTPSVRIGLDNLLGQLSQAESKIRQLEKRVQAMQAERDAMKNEEGRDKAWRERFDALTSEMQQLKAALNASNRSSVNEDTKGKAKARAVRDRQPTIRLLPMNLRTIRASLAQSPRFRSLKNPLMQQRKPNPPRRKRRRA